jgi:hypothetical protein
LKGCWDSVCMRRDGIPKAFQQTANVVVGLHLFVMWLGVSVNLVVRRTE